MRKKLIIAVVIVAVLLAFAALKHNGKKAEAPAKSEATAVNIITAKTVNLKSYVEATGSLEARYSADVKSEVSGIIREVYVDDWVKVKKGQMLAKIDSDGLRASAAQAEAAVASAKSDAMEAETYRIKSDRELTRQQNLKQAGLATQQQLDDASTDAAASTSKVASARAQIASAQENLRQIKIKLAKTDITAPISGTISARNANVGNYADSSTAAPLFTIIDESVYNLTVSIPTVEIADIRPGDQVLFSVDAYPGKKFEGRVAYINPAVNEADRSVSVSIEIPNKGGLLKPGFFATADIYTGKSQNAILIPQTSLFGVDTDKGTARLYVAENGKAVMKTVKTGDTRNGSVAVTAGIRDGDRVIFRGGFIVKDGDRVTVGK